MKFSDIDFSALSQMMNNMSDEEKEQLNDMAQNMMNNINQPKEEEPEEDFYEYLSIQEEQYEDCPGIVLDEVEQAVELEQYYEDVKDSDFSASALFYGKAVLNMLRKYQYPIFEELFDGFKNPSMTTLYSYLFPLMNEDNIHLLVDKGFSSSEQWMKIRNLLQQVYLMVNRAEYDCVSYNDIQILKSLLFNDGGLLLMKECTAC